MVSAIEFDSTDKSLMVSAIEFSTVSIADLRVSLKVIIFLIGCVGVI